MRLLSKLVVLVMVLLGAGTARAQTQCLTTADTVVVNLSGSITYASSPVEQFSTTLTQSRTQSLACGTPTSTVIGEPTCDPNLLPLAKLLAARVFETLDKRIGLYDLSCGSLDGSFSIGQAPFALVSGSFTLRRRSSTSIDAVLTAFVPAGRSALGGFDGGLTFKENVQADAIGTARGSGSVNVAANGTSSHVPMTTTYQFVGNPTARLPKPMQLVHDMNYLCATGTLASDLCVITAVPATPTFALVAFPFAILLLSFFVGKRRARVA